MRAELESLDSLALIDIDWRLAWRATARPKQLAPGVDWATWGIMSGRGFGKSLTGGHWIAEMALDDPGSFNAILAPTHSDLRFTNFEGPVGLTTILPRELIASYNSSYALLKLVNGSTIRGFSDTEPERLRGPQHHRVWCDELAAWTNARETWSMMRLGLRLGNRTQICWTTTPKPVPIIADRVKEEDARHIIIRGSTHENRKNLAQDFYDEILKYAGTRLGRQEIEGELIDLAESGIVKRSQIKMWPADKPLPTFIHIVMSLDTAFTEATFDRKTQEADYSACTVWGLFRNAAGKLCVLLLDFWKEQLGFPELVKRVREESKVTYGEADVPLIGQPLIPSKYASPTVRTGRGIDVILIEDKGSGISLRQTLAMENILSVPYNPGRADKLARLHSVTPMFANDRVYAVESQKMPGQFRSWAEPLIENLCAFHGPGSVEHDDDVDTVTQALIYFMRRFITTFVDKDPMAIAADPVALEEDRVSKLPPGGYRQSRNPYG